MVPLLGLWLYILILITLLFFSPTSFTQVVANWAWNTSLPRLLWLGVMYGLVAKARTRLGKHSSVSPCQAICDSSEEGTV